MCDFFTIEDSVACYLSICSVLVENEADLQSGNIWLSWDFNVSKGIKQIVFMSLCLTAIVYFPAFSNIFSSLEQI